MSPERRMDYALAGRRAQFRIAAENPAKMTRLRELLENHPSARIPASAAASCGALRYPKLDTSRSICRRPTFSSRSPARSVLATRKPNDSVEFCVRKRTAAPRAASARVQNSALNLTEKLRGTSIAVPENTPAKLMRFRRFVRLNTSACRRSRILSE